MFNNLLLLLLILLLLIIYNDFEVKPDLISAMQSVREEGVEIGSLASEVELGFICITAKIDIVFVENIAKGRR